MAREDYYAVLGVSRTATNSEIKAAYRRLTLENHPDRHPGDSEAEERYRLVNEAYDTLSDPPARARYDARILLAGSIDLAQPFGVNTARNLFGNVFGDLFGTQKRQRRHGRDIRYTLTVDLVDAVLGCTRTIEFESPGPCLDCRGSGTRPGGRAPQTCPVCAGRGQIKSGGLFARWTRCGRCDGTGIAQLDPCPTCSGRGTRRGLRSFQVRLPPGTVAGAERVVAGQGEPGRYGAAAGDLRVTVNVRPHAFLQREDQDIVCELHVSITEAARGARILVPTLTGVVTMEVPSSIVSGARLRLRGKGVPTSGTKKAGDQIVKLVVETPDIAVCSDQTSELLEVLERASEQEQLLPRRRAQREAIAATTVVSDPKAT